LVLRSTRSARQGTAELWPFARQIEVFLLLCFQTFTLHSRLRGTF
jgi:hypothetical protein